MNEFLKKYPVPVSGLILGLAASGNLIQNYGALYRNIFGMLSFILFIFIIAKIIRYSNGVAESLKNPIIGSVFPTLSMSIMILSTYLKPYASAASFIIWTIGFVMHIILIIWFTKKFVINFSIKQVFPSWFIVYVGIAVASVTGPAYNMIIAGKSAFWFGFTAYLILLPIIIYRVVKIKEMPQPALPTLVIFSAPASLLLAGYMNSFKEKNMIIVWFLMAVSIIMYIIAIIMLPKLLTLKFYPSYSSFTFPLIISGIAVKLADGFLIKSGQSILLLRYLIRFQEVTGVGITIYVLIRYILFLLPGNEKTINFKS